MQKEPHELWESSIHGFKHFPLSTFRGNMVLSGEAQSRVYFVVRENKIEKKIIYRPRVGIEPTYRRCTSTA